MLGPLVSSYFVVQPILAEETSNWKFRSKSKAVNLRAALE